MEYKNLKFQMKSLSDEGTFEGYAAVKNNVDSYGDIIQDNAFKRTIQNTKQFPILFFHDPSKPVGLSLVMREDAKGLYTKGKLDLSTELGRMVHSGMRNGYIDSMSIGYKVIKDDMNKKGNRLLKEIKLMEYSMITKGFAANELALVSSVKSDLQVDTLIKRIEDFERSLTERDENLMRHKQDEYMADDTEDIGEEEAIDEEDAADEDDSVSELVQEAMELIDDLHAKLGVIKERVEGKSCMDKTDYEEIDDEEESPGDSSKMALAHMRDSLNGTLSFARKAVVGQMDLPLAPRNHPWNGPAAEKRIFEWAGGENFSPAKAQRAFFYVDSANKKERGAYKLPFADIINGKLAAVPRAISSVLGALEGARGGVDIPSADKSKIANRVMAYRKRIDQSEPPKEDLSAILREMKKFARSVK